MKIHTENPINNLLVKYQATKNIKKKFLPFILNNSATYAIAYKFVFNKRLTILIILKLISKLSNYTI
jgi:hypothetical protein